MTEELGNREVSPYRKYLLDAVIQYGPTGRKKHSEEEWVWSDYEKSDRGENEEYSGDSSFNSLSTGGEQCQSEYESTQCSCT